MNLSQEITQDLLQIQAVQIDPKHYFTWTSGIRSPIYCDNRLTLSYPLIRNKIRKVFQMMVDQFEDKPDVIAGCATAGIPHAAWLAEELNLPMIYVRSSAKKHGKQNQIEGELKQGQKVLVIEDLISTGQSALEAVMAIKRAGGHVVSVFAIFTYGLNQAIQNFGAYDIPFQTITGFDQLVDDLVSENKIQTNEKESLLAWRDEMN